MGIRKKISLGFVCLAVMLAFSGAISVAELTRMSGYTRELLETSSVSMSLSKRMLDAAQRENIAMLQMIVLGETDYDPAFLMAREDFQSVLDEAEDKETDREGLAVIKAAWQNYDKLLGNFFDEQANTDIRWFLDVYTTAYDQLTASIKNNMVSSQNALAMRAWELRSNAYRALTPGIITLGVGILMILMFAFLIDFYYTRPILGITKGLKDFISFNLPFNVKAEGRDEIRTLRDAVEELIALFKNKKN